ncbi:hypothetical protein GW17_00030990 [Ensete ventricosum]|nr:hypothetical protein GW17_00030990 [Ensete ventricosum]
MASVGLFEAKLEAFEIRMDARLCALFEEFRLGRSHFISATDDGWVQDLVLLPLSYHVRGPIHHICAALDIAEFLRGELAYEELEEEDAEAVNVRPGRHAKPVILWYQSGISIRRNTHHTNVGDLAGLYGGQPAHATVWGKQTLRCRERSHSEERAFRGMTNPLRERHHKDKQAKKNVYRTKIGMVEFEL